ncbi:M23 family metallopeptidase [Pseudanabaena sp. ABRG5-3]|uniref:M23 family metallopeptidase n=1 Tax=Pseudanabaena sp. ABRG5-3 TaxID=685565 RepID=UPI000DC72FCD|nr:M23 family metallopeptidase [Pseudanabaena sp. ABRG5-3]BBC24738.1 peptidase M23B [Pseudanabaena sp. ABRG5-3]
MRKSTISTITLATLLCFSTNNYLLVSSAYAASKSAVSPDIAVSQTSAPVPQAQPQPAIAPAPTTVEIKTEKAYKSEPANSSSTSRNNRESVQVNIETTSNRSVRAESSRSQPVEIVLENRSSGCQTKASNLSSRKSNLCAPEIAVSSRQNYYQNGNVLYAAASGETAVQVRRLTPEEIAAMSLPSNGDKQMLFPLIAPASISSLFGTRVHPVTGQVRFHQGTDIAAAEGTPVVAAFSGRVEIAGWLGGYGLIVVISHGDTHETRYAHLSEVLVKTGQEVRQGTVIGLVGSTGLATGPHLHFEIWQKMKDGLVVIDPTPQLMLAMDQLQKYLAQSPKSGNKA